MKKKISKPLYWAVTILVAFVFVGSALVKLSGGEQAAAMANGLGGPSNLMLLGVLELLIVVLWLIPRTGVLSVLLGVAYLGGAMAVHFVNNQPIFVPLALQVLIWVAAVIRFPELRSRLFRGHTHASTHPVAAA